MTGAELLAALQTLSAEELALEVETEGCDCTGDAVQLEIDDKCITIRRHDVLVPWPRIKGASYDELEAKQKAEIDALPKVVRTRQGT
jgi:hypothetical protein